MSLEGFQSMNSGAVWEPKQTGSEKDGNLTPRTPNDNSYLTGWYLGSEENVGKDKNSTVHKFKLEKVGDPSTIQGDMNGDEIGIWGTNVLNNRIKEQLTVGMYVAVKWLGKLQPKKQGGRPYHGWELLQKPGVEPISVGGVQATASPAPVTTTAPVQNTAPATDMNAAGGGDDDDLPF